MIHELGITRSVQGVGANIHVLTMEAPRIAMSVQPGQFVNIRPGRNLDPLLRRPFSVYASERTTLSIIFNVVGKGTAMLRDLRAGDPVDMLGPLGTPFRLSEGEFDTALLVGGGLGVAPFPILTHRLKSLNKRIITLLGSRGSDQLVKQFLENLQCSTDDGTAGFHGNVVQLLESVLDSHKPPRPMIFGCGPTAMLRSLAAVAAARSIPCQISVEGPMGCGFGICQGCPVRLSDRQASYALMCKDGPVFDANSVIL